MKLLCYMILISTVYALGGSGDYFTQAHEWYQQGRYQEARDLYEKIEDQSSALLHNKGCCHYQLGEHAQALACWLAAQRAASFIDGVRYQYRCQKLDTQFFERIKEIPSYSRIMWQLLFLIHWFLWCALIWYGYRTRWYRSYWYGICMVVMTMLLWFTGMYLYRAYRDRLTVYGVTVAESGLYANPDEQYHQLAIIPSLSYVIIESSYQAWYRVSTKTHTGWVASASIIIVQKVAS